MTLANVKQAWVTHEWIVLRWYGPMIHQTDPQNNAYFEAANTTVKQKDPVLAHMVAHTHTTQPKLGE